MSSDTHRTLLNIIRTCIAPEELHGAEGIRGRSSIRENATSTSEHHSLRH